MPTTKCINLEHNVQRNLNIYALLYPQPGSRKRISSTPAFLISLPVDTSLEGNNILLLLLFFCNKKKSCKSRTKNFCLPITHFSLVVTYFLIIDNSQNPEINIDTILLTLLQTLSQLFHYSSFSDPGFKPGSHNVSCFYLSLVYPNLGQFLCLSCLS